MNKVFLAGVAGFVAAAVGLVQFSLWQWYPVFSEGLYALDVIFMAIAALANVAYWYGFSILGTRFKNSMVHYTALFALILSILIDVSSAVFTLMPQYAMSSLWDVFGFSMNTAYAAAFVVAGLAVQRLRPHFGDVVLLYAVFAVLSGVIMFIGDFGTFFVWALGSVLTILLYTLGGTILIRAAKK